MAEAVTLLALARPDVGFVARARAAARCSRPRRWTASRPACFQIFGATAARRAACPSRAARTGSRVRGFVSRADRPRPARPDAAPLRERPRRCATARSPGGDRGLSRGGRAAIRGRGLPVRGAAAAPGGRQRAPGQDRGALRRRRARCGSRWSGRCGRRCPRERGARAPRVARPRDRGAAAAARGDRRVQGAGPRAERGLAGRGRGCRGATVARRRRRRALLEAAPPTVLGQHRNTYIVVTRRRGPDAGGPAHRARARALRGAAGRARARAPWSRRCCSLPLVVDARRRACGPVLEAARRRRCATLGFDVEPFGGDAVRVRAVPAVLGGRAIPAPRCEALLRDLAGARVRGLGRRRRARPAGGHPGLPLRGARRPAPGPRRHARDRAATCGRRAQPALCPHGRPTTRAHPPRRRQPLVRPHGLEAASEAGRCARA